MTKFAAVSRQRHGHLRWLRPNGLGFASQNATVPLYVFEVSKVVPSMPMAFLRLGDQFQLSAVLSVTPPLNMFVDPNAHWLASYVPAFFRSHPFRLIKPEEGEEPVLCIDEDSGLISEDRSTGEEFFNADDGPSPALQAVLNFLVELERSRTSTELAVASLEQAGLIVPWPITLNSEQGDRIVEGLYRIDEAGLNALPDDQVGKLRANGALGIAYGQLFSTGQISVFARLARIHAQQVPKPVAALPGDLDKLFGTGITNGDYLRFD